MIHKRPVLAVTAVTSAIVIAFGGQMIAQINDNASISQNIARIARAINITSTAKSKAKKVDKSAKKSENKQEAQPIVENTAPAPEATSSEVTSTATDQTTSNDANSSNVQTQNSTETTPVVETTPTAPETTSVQTREDGFNFLGQHWDIAPFSGSGQTPRYTPYIFQWTSLPNYYLAEQASSAGQALWSLGVGSEIIVNGRILHITKIDHHLNRLDGNTTNYAFNSAAAHALGIQTCDEASGTYISMYWAD